MWLGLFQKADNHLFPDFSIGVGSSFIEVGSRDSFGDVVGVEHVPQVEVHVDGDRGLFLGRIRNIKMSSD